MEMISLPDLRVAYELGLFGLFLIVAIRSWNVRGSGITTRELAFGFAVSQGVELLAVALGRYSYPDWLVYFPPEPAWVPLGVGLGWAALVPCVMRVSETILKPGASFAKLALLDGLIAVGVDLMLDPAVSGAPLHMWDWSGPQMVPYHYWLLDVPVFNFVGWVVLIGATTYQLRTVEAKYTGAKRWKMLGIYLLANLAIAGAVMQLPW